MEMVSIFITLLWYLIPLTIVGIIVFANRGKGQKQADIEINRDKQWMSYINAFRTVTATDRERHLLDILVRGGSPQDFLNRAQYPIEQPFMQVPQPSASNPVIAPAPAMPTQTSSLQKPLDGTLLLLYFGAFLLVASAGLFVAFGGLSGAIRTLLVVITALILYVGGFWLHDRSERLKPAGVSFVATGMAIAPLVGVAAFYYVTAQTHGYALWGVTSVLCLAMYAYAYQKLRAGFIAYLCIFSFVSLFESAIGIKLGAAQYYLWGMIVASLLLRLLNRYYGTSETAEPSRVSSYIVVPLAIVISCAVAAQNISWQLSVSLLLAAAFYAHEAIIDQRLRATFIAVAHALTILAAITASFVWRRRVEDVAAVLLIVSGIHAILVHALGGHKVISTNIASIGCATAVLTTAFGVPNHALFTGAVIVLLLFSSLVTIAQYRSDAFVLAALTLIAIPFVFGQITFTHHLDLTTQAYAALLPVLLLLITHERAGQAAQYLKWLTAADTMLIISGTVVLAMGWAAGSWAVIAVGFVLSIVAAWTARSTPRVLMNWPLAAAIMCVPVVRSLGDVHSFSFVIACLLGLLMSVVYSLMSRAELVRWVVTALTLVLPLALGNGGLSFSLSATGFAYAYFIAALGLLLSRSIARGVIFASSKIPLVSYYHSASISFVVGYTTAAFLAVAISMWSPASRLHTSILLGLVLLFLFVITFKVEKNKQIIALAPWLAQLLLVSLIRAGDGIAAGNTVIILSTIIALSFCWSIKAVQKWLAAAHTSVSLSAIFSLYAFLLMSASYMHSNFIVPSLLLVAGGVTLYYNWLQVQSTREWIGTIITIACMLLVYDAGIHSIQVYAHILGATFAVYAVWRGRLGDINASKGYEQVLYYSVTVPLVLQALGGSSVIGWWLLIEQIGFMIAGVSLRHKFLAFAGLYVALAAVLYQLRHLGWAALTVLAIFVVGIAIYRLLKVDHPSVEKPQ